jgi:hypothetical protein
VAVRQVQPQDPGGTGCSGSLCHQHVHLEPGQLGRQIGETFLASLCIAVLQDEVLALDIAEVAQPLEAASPLQRARHATSPARATTLPLVGFAAGVRTHPL